MLHPTADTTLRNSPIALVAISGLIALESVARARRDGISGAVAKAGAETAVHGRAVTADNLADLRGASEEVAALEGRLAVADRDWDGLFGLRLCHGRGEDGEGEEEESSGGGGELHVA